MPATSRDDYSEHDSSSTESSRLIPDYSLSTDRWYVQSPYIENDDEKYLPNNRCRNISETSTVREVNIGVYRQRFWILGVFSYVAFVTILIWGTFGPIMESAKFAYGWDDGYIALLDGWGPIFSIICMIPFNWATNKYGLRMGMILAISLVTSATAIRCITVDQKLFTYLASVAAILDGMGSCLTLSLPAMLSSTWFPKNERGTATAVGALATQLAGAGMYFSPLIVRTPAEGVSREEVRDDIQKLMYIHFGMAAVGFLCILAYFPAKPPKPPSLSSSVERVNYFKSIKMLVRNPHVMIVMGCYVACMSIPLSWISVMDFSLKCLQISQDQSMWIAITTCTVSPLLAFSAARITDRINGRFKVYIAGLLLCASCFYIWILLITENIIAPSLVQVFIAVVCAISFQYSSVPLFIELAVELAYPCPESVVGAMFTMLMDIADGGFFLIMMIPSTCFRWLSFILLASSSITVLPIMVVKEVHKRSNLDDDSPPVERS